MVIVQVPVESEQLPTVAEPSERLTDPVGVPASAEVATAIVNVTLAG